MTIKRSIIA